MFLLREYAACGLILALIGFPFILLASIIFLVNRYAMDSARWIRDSASSSLRFFRATPVLIPVPVRVEAQPARQSEKIAA